MLPPNHPHTAAISRLFPVWAWDPHRLPRRELPARILETSISRAPVKLARGMVNEVEEAVMVVPLVVVMCAVTHLPCLKQRRRPNWRNKRGPLLVSNSPSLGPQVPRRQSVTRTQAPKAPTIRVEMASSSKVASEIILHQLDFRLEAAIVVGMAEARAWLWAQMDVGQHMAVVPAASNSRLPWPATMPVQTANPLKMFSVEAVKAIMLVIHRETSRGIGGSKTTANLKARISRPQWVNSARDNRKDRFQTPLPAASSPATVGGAPLTSRLVHWEAFSILASHS